LCYQALWDLQADNLYGRLGTDINLWMKCLSDIKTSRATFDTTDTRKEFGPIVIDYAKVQSKVSLKYDSWHKETLSKFGSLLGNEMSEFHSQVSKVTMNLLFKIFTVKINIVFLSTRVKEFLQNIFP
jgi:dynein heavy chain 1, cytosolic